MPGGAPEVTASYGVCKVLKLQAWLDPALRGRPALVLTPRPFPKTPPIRLLCQHLLVRCLLTPTQLSSKAAVPLRPTQWAKAWVSPAGQ